MDAPYERPTALDLRLDGARAETPTQEFRRIIKLLIEHDRIRSLDQGGFAE